MTTQTPKLAEASDSEQIQREPKPVQSQTIKYRRGVVHSDNDDSDDPFLSTQGFGLYVRRDEEVVLPEDAVQRMAESVTPVYFTIPGQGTFQRPGGPRYRWTDHGEGTAAEFHKLLEEKRLVSRDPLPRVTPLMRTLGMAMSASKL